MDKQPEIIILVGPPGSGKSTIATRYADYIRVSQDDQGKSGHMDVFKEALEKKQDIIIDRMNFNKSQRRRYLDPAHKAGYSSVIFILHVPMDECLQRCQLRKNHPTIKNQEDAYEAVNFFFKNYERVTDDEANSVNRLGWKEPGMATKAIVCDLDGTMANIEHRRHHIPRRQPGDKKRPRQNWKAFFEEMIFDEVNEWCRELISSMSDRYPIIYATGRAGEYNDLTRNWLAEKHLTFPGAKLFSRLEKDYRKDSIIKEIILEFEIKPRYDILFIVDDRKQVVDMWRSHGYTVLQCAEGDF